MLDALSISQIHLHIKATYSLGINFTYLNSDFMLMCRSVLLAARFKDKMRQKMRDTPATLKLAKTTTNTHTNIQEAFHVLCVWLTPTVPCMALSTLSALQLAYPISQFPLNSFCCCFAPRAPLFVMLNCKGCSVACIALLWAGCLAGAAHECS